jgi:hypothetical protein
MLSETQTIARRDQINALIDSAGSTFLAIEFVKADSTVRTIQVQLPVAKKHIVAEYESDAREQAVATRKANNPNLRNLFDVARKGFRSVNLDTVLAVTVRGTRFDIGGVPA